MELDITKQDQEFENATPTPTPPVTPDPVNNDDLDNPTSPEKKVDEEMEDPFIEDEDIVTKKTKDVEDEDEEPVDDVEEEDDKVLNDKITKALESHPKIKMLDEREAKLNVDEFLAKPENEVFKKHKDTIVKYVQNAKLKSVFKAEKLTEVAALLAAGRAVWGAVRDVQNTADAVAEANRVSTPTQRPESGSFDYMNATPEQLAKREALVIAGKAKL